MNRKLTPENIHNMNVANWTSKSEFIYCKAHKTRHKNTFSAITTCCRYWIKINILLVNSILKKKNRFYWRIWLWYKGTMISVFLTSWNKCAEVVTTKTLHTFTDLFLERFPSRRRSNRKGFTAADVKIKLKSSCVAIQMNHSTLYWK